MCLLRESRTAEDTDMWSFWGLYLIWNMYAVAEGKIKDPYCFQNMIQMFEG